MAIDGVLLRDGVGSARLILAKVPLEPVGPWVLEFSPQQRALHLRPMTEAPGPGDWRPIDQGRQRTMECRARFLEDLWELGAEP